MNENRFDADLRAALDEIRRPAPALLANSMTAVRGNHRQARGRLRVPALAAAVIVLVVVTGGAWLAATRDLGRRTAPAAPTDYHLTISSGEIKDVPIRIGAGESVRVRFRWVDEGIHVLLWASAVAGTTSPGIGTSLSQSGTSDTLTLSAGGPSLEGFSFGVAPGTVHLMLRDDSSPPQEQLDIHLERFAGCPAGVVTPSQLRRCAVAPTISPPKLANGSGKARLVIEGSTNSGQHAVQIIDIGGGVIAERPVATMPKPRLPVPALPPTQAISAAGAAYYADPAGRIHRLDPAGTETVVATFPLTNPQQELTFAVSPDGKRLAAIILSAPPVHDPPPADRSQPFFADGSRWSSEFLVATASGPTQSVLRTDLGPATTSIQPTKIVGWDRNGILALEQFRFSYPTSRYPGRALIHLGLDGSHLDRLGGADCGPLDLAADGTMLCYTGEYQHAFEVRSQAGDLIWRQERGVDGAEVNPFLAPDHLHIATSKLFTPGQPPVQLPARAVGWLDSQTLVLSTGGGIGNLEILSLSELAIPYETGVGARFIGTV